MSNQPKTKTDTKTEGLSMKSTEFIDFLSKRGLICDDAIEDEEIRKANQEKRRAMFHNTLVLLQHYRSIRWVLECFPNHIAEELNAPMNDIDALIATVTNELELDNAKLVSRMQSIQRSRMLMERINEALTVLKEKPDNGEALYQLIYVTYLSPKKCSHQKILDELMISGRSYYKLRQQAINIISIRLWSAPVVELDSWLEVLTLLELL